MPTQYLLMEACHFHELPILFPSKSHLRKFLSTDNLCCCFQNKINFVCHIFFEVLKTSPRDFGAIIQAQLTTQFSRNWGYKTWILFEREEPRRGEPKKRAFFRSSHRGTDIVFPNRFPQRFHHGVVRKKRPKALKMVCLTLKENRLSWPFLSAHVNPTHSYSFPWFLYNYLLNMAQIHFFRDVWVWHFFLSGALVFVEAQHQASWFGDLPGSGHFFWPFGIKVVDSILFERRYP